MEDGGGGVEWSGVEVVAVVGQSHKSEVQYCGYADPVQNRARPTEPHTASGERSAQTTPPRERQTQQW